MKKFFVLIFILLVLFAGCTNQVKENKIDEDLEFRINTLYGHTLIMEQYSSKEDLIKFGLDVTVLDNTSFLTPMQKVDILEKSYNIKTEGNYEERVKKLENKMNQIMESYYN